MVTEEGVANRLSGVKSFTSLVACSGYWQLQVDDESSKLLTFNTPWGRYRFTRLLFGVSPAPEIYQREMDRLFEGVSLQKNLINLDEPCRRGLCCRRFERLCLPGLLEKETFLCRSLATGWTSFAR